MKRPQFLWATFCCLAILWGKNFFLTSDLNFCSFRLKPFSLLLSLLDCVILLFVLFLDCLTMVFFCSSSSFTDRTSQITQARRHNQHNLNYMHRPLADKEKPLTSICICKLCSSQEPQIASPSPNSLCVSKAESWIKMIWLQRFISIYGKVPTGVVSAVNPYLS